MLSPRDLHRLASGMTIDEWVELLTGQGEPGILESSSLPTLPAPELQALFVGSSGEQAFREGSRFYSVVKSQTLEHGLLLDEGSRVLDFGVGWGRYVRFFYRDVPWDRLWGFDAWDLAVNTCRETGVYGQIVKVELLPPTPIVSNFFDLIYAYSVFSHLSPEASRMWIDELARLLRPGGFLVLTTQGRTFIDYCAGLAESGGSSEWHRSLAVSFPDATRAKCDYDSGVMLYAPNGGGPALPGNIYGDAIVPRGHIEAKWTEKLDLVAFEDSRELLPQALVVMRKPL